MTSSVFDEKRTLKDVSKEIFHDTASEEIIDQSYKRDGEFVVDFPLSAQRHIWQAKEKFFKKNKDNFQMSIELERTHTIDDSINDETMRVIRPLFADAYLQHTGIANTEESVKLFNRLSRINQRNIEIHTKKRGFLEEQLIIQQVPKEIKGESWKDPIIVAEKCDTIRHNLKFAWNIVERNFPRESAKIIPKPFIASSKFKTVSARRSLLTPKNKTKSTLPKSRLRSQNPSPFLTRWFVFMSRTDISCIIRDFLDHYKNPSIADFAQSWISCRLLFYVIRYTHSILICERDDYFDFIRARALWYVMGQQFPPKTPQFAFQAAFVLMAKVCCAAVFAKTSPDSYSSIPEMEAAVYEFIGEFLDPFRLFDTLDDPQGRRSYSHNPPRLVSGKSLSDDVYMLLEDEVFDHNGEEIAKLMIGSIQIDRITSLLGSESWGDQTEIEEEDAADKRQDSRLPVQRSIQLEIKKLNMEMPRPPPSWIRNPNSPIKSSRRSSKKL